MSDQWRTPPEVFEALNREFNFNVDAAATAENALVGRYYTVETDGANLDHYGPGDVVFCNPPYDGLTVARFVECAAISAEQGALWVLLLNATTTDTRWFHKWIWDARLHRPRGGVEVRFRPGRIRFNRPDGTPGESPRYANMVVVIRPPR